MQYWEVVAGKLSDAGWLWGYCSAVTRDGSLTRIVEAFAILSVLTNY